MSKSTSETSVVAFADLESFVRERAQTFIQGVLEEEVEELLGRSKSERRETDHPVGYQYEHGFESSPTTASGEKC